MTTIQDSSRDKFIHFRVTSDEDRRIRERAKNAGLQLSDFIRQSSMNGKVEVSRIEEHKPLHSEVAFELRRIGAMLKSMYPKDGNFTTAEKRKWWSSISAILGAADRVDGSNP